MVSGTELVTAAAAAFFFFLEVFLAGAVLLLPLFSAPLPNLTLVASSLPSLPVVQVPCTGSPTATSARVAGLPLRVRMLALVSE